MLYQLYSTDNTTPITECNNLSLSSREIVYHLKGQITLWHKSFIEYHWIKISLMIGFSSLTDINYSILHWHLNYHGLFNFHFILTNARVKNQIIVQLINASKLHISFIIVMPWIKFNSDYKSLSIHKREVEQTLFCYLFIIILLWFCFYFFRYLMFSQRKK